MTWVYAAITAVWGFVVVVWRAIWDVHTGEIKQQLKDVTHEEEAVVRANQFAQDVASMSRANRLQYLSSRGRVRNTKSDR